LRIGKVELARPTVHQVGLALDHVGPGRRIRILEIGHEDFGARIEGIDDHLAVGRSGDLDAPVFKVGRDMGHCPFALTDGARFGQKIGKGALVEELLALRPSLDQSAATLLETTMKARDEGHRIARQDPVVTGLEHFGEADALREFRHLFLAFS
jgi:hypothetical protein